MSAPTTFPADGTRESSPERPAVDRSWRAPVALALFAAGALALFLLFGRDGTSTFVLSTSDDLVQLPRLTVPTRTAPAVVAVVLALLAGAAFWLVATGRRVRAWYSSLFAVLFLAGFLTWAAAGQSVPLPGLLIGSVALSVPLIFGAMGGVISERVGVVNVAIEGQLLAGAFVSAFLASVTHSTVVGLLGAVVAGMLVSFVLAAFSIKYWVDQVIAGVVLNVLVLGLTNFLFSQVLAKNGAAFNNPPRFPTLEIPVLGQIPVVGPVLFQQTAIVYVMYATVATVYLALFHTRWGLRLRAVGEHPQAADTVGIKVNTTRFRNVTLAGAIAGLGGSYFTLGSVGSFSKDMSAGMGFIALAAVIFGRWDPVRATLAALLFGFATSLQTTLSTIGSPVPSEFMLMLPYVVTIFAVVGLVGQVRGPAASGKPYRSR